jgi:hypothetical protein
MTEEKSSGLIKGFLKDRLRPFADISEKYRTPRIKMTRQVRWALLLLRLYLIAMVLLLAYKFFTSI